MSGHNVIAIKQPWVSVVTGLVSVIIVGGFTFAWSVNAQQNVTQTKLDAIEDANLPERITRLEVIQQGTQRDVDDVKQTTARIEAKLDAMREENSINNPAPAR